MRDQSISAYPLHWPLGWPKTQNRQQARFKTTLEGALRNLKREIELMSGEKLVLSSNYTLGAVNPKEPGVVAYFTWVEEKYPQRKETEIAIPCDRWNRIEDNVQAIALTVEAMRGMERWGAKHMIKAMFTGFKALPNGEDWRRVLGVSEGCTAAVIKAAYNDLAKKHHPDKGGNHDDFVRIQRAYETAEQLGLVS